jgi:UDP-N-acetylglucosamine 2-epimerase (non-hydrolysing)
MTMHRPKNVDNETSLRLILEIISDLSSKLKVVIPVHPRTLKNISLFGLNGYIDKNKNIKLLGPIEYLAFQNLILNATLVMTDSGGIQEETTFRKVPCLTIRENTERPSTIEIGSNELVELNKELILAKVNSIIEDKSKASEIPSLWDGKATERIVSILNDVL